MFLFKFYLSNIVFITKQILALPCFIIPLNFIRISLFKQNESAWDWTQQSKRIVFINTNTFLCSCNTALLIVEEQIILLIVHNIKNCLDGRTCEMVLSRKLSERNIIENLVESHIDDNRDLRTIILDLNKFRQMPNQSPLWFFLTLKIARIKTLLFDRKATQFNMYNRFRGHIVYMILSPD